MGGIGSSGTKGANTRHREKTDPDARYIMFWCSSDLYDSIKREAEYTTDGNVSEVVRIAVQEYIEYRIEKLLEAK